LLGRRRDELRSGSWGCCRCSRFLDECYGRGWCEWQMWRILCAPVQIQGWRLGVSLVVIVVETRLRKTVLLLCVSSYVSFYNVFMV
jgi:hypothetical protein